MDASTDLIDAHKSRCPRSQLAPGCLETPADGIHEKCKTLEPATHLTRQFLLVVRAGFLNQ